MFCSGTVCWEQLREKLAIEDVPGDKALAVSIIDSDSGEEQVPPAKQRYFFRIMDISKAFTQLTFVGDKSAMLNVDFLVQPYSTMGQDNGSNNVTVVPLKATLSETFQQNKKTTLNHWLMMMRY